MGNKGCYVIKAILMGLTFIKEQNCTRDTTIVSADESLFVSQMILVKVVIPSCF